MFYMNLDISELLKLDAEMAPALERAAQEGAKKLTAATHAHIVEQVQNKLHSSREKYLENLGFHQVDNNTWVVDLTPGAMFIEEGLPPNFDMIKGLLDDSPRPWAKGKQSTGKTKIAKDGSRYRIIPFDHTTAKNAQPKGGRDLTETIMKELKARKLPGIGTLEMGANGQPKQGFVRGFNIVNAPVKSAEGPGQGKGAIGAVRQGPTGIPFLQGVRIYQRQVQDKQGGTHTKKFVMTFRVVSTKHEGQGRWVHPGLEAKRFLDEAYEWASNEWHTKIWPELMDGALGSL